jgi:hypothetical protein
MSDSQDSSNDLAHRVPNGRVVLQPREVTGIRDQHEGRIGERIYQFDCWGAAVAPPVEEERRPGDRPDLRQQISSRGDPLQIFNDTSVDSLIRRKRVEGFSIEVGCLVWIRELRPPQDVEPMALVRRRYDLTAPVFRADLIEERELILGKSPRPLAPVLVVEDARRRWDADPDQAGCPIQGVCDRVQDRQPTTPRMATEIQESCCQCTRSASRSSMKLLTTNGGEPVERPPPRWSKR